MNVNVNVNVNLPVEMPRSSCLCLNVTEEEAIFERGRYESCGTPSALKGPEEQRRELSFPQRTVRTNKREERLFTHRQETELSKKAKS